MDENEDTTFPTEYIEVENVNVDCNGVVVRISEVKTLLLTHMLILLFAIKIKY